MKSKFIVFVVIAILFVVGLGVFMNKGANAPSKYDDFAKALTSGGAEFYGAFWCPHCQEQKKEFGNSKKYLPYIECSNPDQSVTDICVEKKIESYPTWMFKNGITLSSATGPSTVCQPKPGVAGEDAICAQIASKYFKTYIFPEYKFSFKSMTDPVKKNNIWRFGADAATQGEIPLEFLASQIGFTLPQ